MPFVFVDEHAVGDAIMLATIDMCIRQMTDMACCQVQGVSSLCSNR